MAQNTTNTVIGIFAVVIGAMLVMGALSFLGVTFLIPPVPSLLLVAAVVQLMLGLTGCAAGCLVMRGNVAARYVLIAIAVCVIINTIVLAATMAVWANSAA